MQAYRRFNVAKYLLGFLFFAGDAWAKVNFEKEIAPIFASNCLKCHGPEKEKSGLRLDQRAIMLKGGDSGLPTIVPGRASKSYLMEVITTDDTDISMPPEGERLTSNQISLLRDWIDEGAEIPGQMDQKFELKSDHWSFQKVQKHTPPSQYGEGIDAFINAKLSEAEIEANEHASAEVLIRRVSLVLTGIAPSMDRISKFKEEYQQGAEVAYQKLLDELFASPQFGVRWAQHWLDTIRWAETNGSESNLYRKNAWLYRDYVTKSFNEDLPYNRFITEQIAGDQLGVGEATGFLVAGPHVPAATVGRQPAAIRQARADRMDEILSTVGASMMGMTVSCARCHNHKFDPISIQDYYSLAAVFQGVEFGGRIPEWGSNDPRKKRMAQLYPLLDEERKILQDGVGVWTENWGGYLDMVFPKTTTKVLKIEFDRPKIFIDELEVFGPKDDRHNLALAANGTLLVEDPEMITDGSPVAKANDGEYGTMIWKGFAPKGSKKKPWVEIRFKEAQEVNRFRISSNREYYFETDYLTRMPNGQFPGYRVLSKEANGSWREIGNTNGSHKKINQNAILKQSSQRLQKIIREIGKKGPQHAFVGRFVEPVKTHVLHRGSPENPKDEVPPASFEILKGDLGLTSETPGPARRMAFAKWMTKPENPLTSRVMVNRIWQHVFGAGLVVTGADFGLAGAPPSHPKLLDWMANKFVEGDWSMKQIIRLMVESETFRRSSLPESLSLQKDAGSALLWRYPPRRVEAEVIRDNILLASGKMNLEVGGESFRIHNVKKTYAQWEVVDNYGPDTWRRMLFQERMRRVDDQMFTAFDFPDCGQVRAKRPVSTTPLQALNLMNSNFVVEQSQFIAQRAKSEVGDEPALVSERIFELILGRQPDDHEVQLSADVSADLLARALINSNEFIFLQ